jgi:hypothetical protein
MFFKVQTYICIYCAKRNIFVEVKVSDLVLLPTWPWICLSLVSTYSKIRLYVIPGFHREVDEIWALLAYYTVYGGNALRTFRHNLSVLSSRVTKSDKKDKKTLADGTDMLSQNVGKIVPTASA